MSRPGIAVASYDNAGEDNMRKPPRSPISSAAWIIGCLIGMSIVTGTALSNAGGILLAGIIFVMIAGSLALILKALSSPSPRAHGPHSTATAKPTDDPAVRAMADASMAFYRFLQELDRTPRCQKELSQTPGLENLDAHDNPFSLSQKLAYLVFCDVRDVYTRLGHNTKSLHNREGIGYAMLVLLLLKQGVGLAWFDNPEQTEKVLRIVENLSRSDVGDMTIAGHEGELRFALIFGQLHHEQDWVNRYATVLYRWASLVAKANGSISQAESETLKSIMDVRREDDALFSGNVSVSGGSTAQSRCPTGNGNENGQEAASMVQEGATGEGLKTLEKLIGLEPVKREVYKLTSFIDIQRKRGRVGLRAAPVSYHCVFTGNPGTGKTTVARILAEIYHEMGVVKKGHLVETDRSGLIGEYVGQTAVKTNTVVDSALDGVLFIDEAYSLIQGGEKDYGREAIATLLKRMEDDRKRLVVILAGYTDEMKAFIDSNPGLQSRFNRYIEFPDYSAQELASIFLQKANECQYTCDGDVQASIVDIMERAVAAKDKNFGNGRFVRNLFETAIQRQAVRLSTQSPLTAEMLAELTLHDLGFTYDD